MDKEINNLSTITRQMCYLIGSQIRLEPKEEYDWTKVQAIQTHVDFILDAVELSQSLDDLIDKVLTPASIKLVECLNKRNARYCYRLPLPPKGFDCSIHSYNCCSLRGIVNREHELFDENEQPKIVNLFRFDILWSA